MKKIVIFGNSGSGKSTLAKSLKKEQDLAHLDLDAIAWQPLSTQTQPVRRPIEESKSEIEEFIGSNPSWVIEGCYADLLALVLPESSEIIYLDLPIEDCIANAKKRPWEPHKYESKEAQDNNLDMLVQWIAQYEEREDEFSRSAHQQLVASYTGKTSIVKSNLRHR